MDILERGMSGKSSNIKESSKFSGSAGAGEFLVAAIVYTGKFRDLITGGNRNICSLLEAIGCAIELIDGLELLGCCNQERIFRRTGAAVKERNDFIFVIFELLCRIACGDKVGACALSGTVGGIEFYKCAAGDGDLGSALCAVLVIAVQYEFVSLGCIGILLLNGISTALNGQFTLIHIHGMDVADKGAIFNGEFRLVLHIDCIAVIFLGFECAVASNGQIAAGADGKQRPIIRALFPQVICVADGLAIQVELDSLCNNDSFRDVNILQQFHFAAYGNSLLQRQIVLSVDGSDSLSGIGGTANGALVILPIGMLSLAADDIVSAGSGMPVIGIVIAPGIRVAVAVAAAGAAAGAAAAATAGTGGALIHSSGRTGAGGANRGILAALIGDGDLAVTAVLDIGFLGLNGDIAVGLHLLHGAVAGDGGILSMVLHVLDSGAIAGVNICAGGILAHDDVVDLGAVLGLNCALFTVQRHIVRGGVVQNDLGVVAADRDVIDVLAALNGHFDVIGGHEQLVHLAGDGHIVRHNEDDTLAIGIDRLTGLVRIGADGAVKDRDGGRTGDVVLRSQLVGSHAAHNARLDQSSQHTPSIGRHLRGVCIFRQIGVFDGLDTQSAAQHDHGALTGDGRVGGHGTVEVALEDTGRRTAVDGVVMPGIRGIVGKARVFCGGQFQESCENCCEVGAGELPVGVKLTVIALNDAVAAPSVDGCLSPVSRDIAVSRLYRTCAYREQTD